MQAIIMKLRKTNLFNNVSIGDELQLQKTLEKQQNIISIIIDEAQNIHIISEVENKYNFINNGKNVYKVHSSYFNGVSDRTTYDGVYHGKYDICSYDEAVQIALLNCEGKHKIIEVFNNLQKELNFLPAKYKKILMSDSYYSKEDGYWLYLNDGFLTENGFGCHTIHEYTQKDVLSQFRQVVAVAE